MKGMYLSLKGRCIPFKSRIPERYVHTFRNYSAGEGNGLLCSAGASAHLRPLRPGRCA